MTNNDVLKIDDIVRILPHDREVHDFVPGTIGEVRQIYTDVEEPYYEVYSGSMSQLVQREHVQPIYAVGDLVEVLASGSSVNDVGEVLPITDVTHSKGCDGVVESSAYQLAERPCGWVSEESIKRVGRTTKPITDEALQAMTDDVIEQQNQTNKKGAKQMNNLNVTLSEHQIEELLHHVDVTDYVEYLELNDWEISLMEQGKSPTEIIDMIDMDNFDTTAPYVVFDDAHGTWYTTEFLSEILEDYLDDILQDYLDSTL